MAGTGDFAIAVIQAGGIDCALLCTFDQTTLVIEISRLDVDGIGGYGSLLIVQTHYSLVGTVRTQYTAVAVV